MRRQLPTTVYVKLVAPDQLLLSETVCRLLGIVSYHPSVQSVGSSQFTEETVNDSEVNASCTETIETEKSCDTTNDALSTVSGNDKPRSIKKDIPSVEKTSTEVQQSPMLPAKEIKPAVSSARVRLVSAVRLPACHLATVPVQVKDMRGPVLIEPEGLVDDCL